MHRLCNHTANAQHSDLHIPHYKPSQYKHHSSCTAVVPRKNEIKSKRQPFRYSISSVKTSIGGLKLFFFLSHSINICLSVFQYFTTYLYDIPLLAFFSWPLTGFHSCQATPKKLVHSTTILIYTTLGWLHLNASQLSQRGRETPPLNSPQMTPNPLK